MSKISINELNDNLKTFIINSSLSDEVAAELNALADANIARAQAIYANTYVMSVGLNDEE